MIYLLSHILFVSTALFFIGMYGLFTRRNMITMLMSIEFILNSVNINFVVLINTCILTSSTAFSLPYLLSRLRQQKRQWRLRSLLIFIAVTIN